jgi:hypothetical protein
MRSHCCLCVCVPPNFLVFCAFRVVSKEGRRFFPELVVYIMRSPCCVSVCLLCPPPPHFWSLWGLWDHLAVCQCLLCPPPLHFWSLWGLWDRLAVCVSPLSLLGKGPSVLPPNFFVLYAVRVISEESRRLVLPRTSCFSWVGTGIAQSVERLGYGLHHRGTGVRFPTGETRCYLLQGIQTGSGAQPASDPMGTGGSIPEREERRVESMTIGQTD